MNDYSILLTLILFIFVLFVPSLVCAEAANRKGLSGFGFFMFSLLFTPLLGFLAVIAFPKKE